jgi:hypothetical protein
MKIIIDNRSDLSDKKSLESVLEVVKLGKISGDGNKYCYLAIIEYNNKKYQVGYFENKKSIRFLILNSKNTE